ncbi:hypothetical protein AcW1_001704 [Taiwanofungus camphoratus]|nr:hypothetical protein AcV7_001563 [Antrodia cinnamomea]KAI0945490.1 hypothetical protein AcW1_001704 [Antrodia cinnamomea]
MVLLRYLFSVAVALYGILCNIPPDTICSLGVLTLNYVFNSVSVILRPSYTPSPDPVAWDIFSNVIPTPTPITMDVLTEVPTSSPATTITPSTSTSARVTASPLAALMLIGPTSHAGPANVDAMSLMISLIIFLAIVPAAVTLLLVILRNCFNGQDFESGAEETNQWHFGTVASRSSVSAGNDLAELFGVGDTLRLAPTDNHTVNFCGDIHGDGIDVKPLGLPGMNEALTPVIASDTSTLILIPNDRDTAKLNSDAEAADITATANMNVDVSVGDHLDAHPVSVVDIIATSLTGSGTIVYEHASTLTTGLEHSSVGMDACEVAHSASTVVGGVADTDPSPAHISLTVNPVDLALPDSPQLKEVSGDISDPFELTVIPLHTELVITAHLLGSATVIAPLTSVDIIEASKGGNVDAHLITISDTSSASTTDADIVTDMLVAASAASSDINSPMMQVDSGSTNGLNRDTVNANPLCAHAAVNISVVNIEFLAVSEVTDDSSTIGIVPASEIKDMDSSINVDSESVTANASNGDLDNAHLIPADAVTIANANVEDVDSVLTSSTSFTTKFDIDLSDSEASNSLDSIRKMLDTDPTCISTMVPLAEDPIRTVLDAITTPTDSGIIINEQIPFVTTGFGLSLVSVDMRNGDIVSGTSTLIRAVADTDTSATHLFLDTNPADIALPDSPKLGEVVDVISSDASQSTSLFHTNAVLLDDLSDSDVTVISPVIDTVDTSQSDDDDECVICVPNAIAATGSVFSNGAKESSSTSANGSEINSTTGSEINSLIKQMDTDYSNHLVDASPCAHTAVDINVANVKTQAVSQVIHDSETIGVATSSQIEDIDPTTTNDITHVSNGDGDDTHLVPVCAIATCLMDTDATDDSRVFASAASVAMNFDIDSSARETSNALASLPEMIGADSLKSISGLSSSIHEQGRESNATRSVVSQDYYLPGYPATKIAKLEGLVSLEGTRGLGASVHAPGRDPTSSQMSASPDGSRSPAPTSIRATAAQASPSAKSARGLSSSIHASRQDLSPSQPQATRAPAHTTPGASGSSDGTRGLSASIHAPVGSQQECMQDTTNVRRSSAPSSSRGSKQRRPGRNRK